MSTAQMLHQTAMEFYDLAGIYKAKGRPEFFDGYRKTAWLLEKEAAWKMLAEPEDFTFKYLVILSAGQLGYDMGYYEDAKKILELGLLGNPVKGIKNQIEILRDKITKKQGSIPQTPKESELTISGMLTSADIETRHIKVRESGREQLHSIAVSIEMIKTLLRFYLGEWVTIQLDKDDKGSLFIKTIHKAA